MKITHSLAILGIATALCSFCAATPNDENDSSAANAEPISESQYECGVRVRQIPDSLTFAGERVPINYAYVREAIDREVLTTSCMHTSTTLTLRRSGRYLPIIEPILAEYGIPNDFKYLCMAESGLNVNAYSPAHAAGLWQFLSSTGREYGMLVNNDVDFRYSVEQSTIAACKYIKSAYQKFGSWTLAAASYNAGQAGVSRRLEIQGVTNYWDLFLPEETMRYLPRILSFKILTADPAAYGFMITPQDYYRPYTNYRIATISDKQIDWSKFAASQGTNYRQMRILNNWIRNYTYSNTSGRTFEVKIPLPNFIEQGY